MLSYGKRELKTQISKLTQEIWKEERIPEGWNESLIYTRKEIGRMLKTITITIQNICTGNTKQTTGVLRGTTRMDLGYEDRL